MELAILPECYIDTNLIETIAPPLKGYNHQKGCGTVTKRMQEKLKDCFALGIIDKDKKELKYIQEFNIEIDTGNLQLLKHKESNKHHYLILINPAIEKWILDNVKEVKISLDDYGLPSDLKELTKITKKITSKNDVTFKQLFSELKLRKAKNIEILSDWIIYLKQNTYKSNIDEIRKMTDKKYFL